MQVKNLIPMEVFQYFHEITQVPRPSKKEEKIIEYLLNFAKQHNLEAKTDDVGNVLITKQASAGYENKKTVILQSHIDMVCEKNNGVEFNFYTDPINTYIDEGWVKAQGTTLGADCGIGMAASLGVLADKNINHGKIEALFTVDEETGLTGANALQSGFMTGDILLNLDSEDEGEVFVGCAGGMRTEILFTYTPEVIPTNYVGLQINISGLIGGHSGDEIHKGRANSIKLLNRILWQSNSKYDIRIHKYEGGNLHNAIPRESYAIFTIDKEYVSDLKNDVENFRKILNSEYKHTEGNIVIDITEVEQPQYVIDEATQLELLCGLCATPNGVINMSFEIEDLVETSSNLASIKFVGNNQILITTSQRSSVETRKQNASDVIKSVFRLTSATINVNDGYPGWNPNMASEILHVTLNSYRNLFGKNAKVKAIHAGLECGLFLEKYPNLDMVSIGPTVKGAHSPDERLEISTVQKFWDLLVDILKNTPNK